jgi:plasmid stability protein
VPAPQLTGPAIVASIASNAKEVVPLTAVSVRNLDERVKERLRIRAAHHGRSMEAEIRAILTDAVSGPGEAAGLIDAILDRFGELGGVELDIPARADRARAADVR